jgi:hypothetical protein
MFCKCRFAAYAVSSSCVHRDGLSDDIICATVQLACLSVALLIPWMLIVLWLLLSCTGMAVSVYADHIIAGRPECHV